MLFRSSHACSLYFQLRSHSYLFEAEQDDEEEEPEMSLWFALVALLGVTVVTSFCADYLVGSIDEFAADFGIPKAFIGLVLLPIVGNAAEHVTSVWMAVKGKMELTIGVCVGSSIQIAIGVLRASKLADSLTSQLCSSFLAGSWAESSPWLSRPTRCVGAVTV